MDCVDGTIARVTKKTSSMGEFIDAQSGYTVMAFIYFAVGMAAFNTDSCFLSAESKYWLIIIGALSSIFNITARLINSKYAFCDLKKAYINKAPFNVNEANEKPVSLFGKIRVFADYHLGLVGAFIPILVLCQFFGYYDIVTIGYCFYSFAGFLFASVYYAYKSK
jgi:phosphatidylglycerophosphate synthase